ncbi:MAG: helix-turn-helix transcriptional regulator [Saprospiraceae bacterium]
MPPRILLTVSFVFSACLLNGQAIDLVAFRNLSDAQRYRSVQDLPFFFMDSAAVRQTIDQLLPLAETQGDRRTVFVLKFRQFIERDKLGLSQPEIFQVLEELESLSAQGGWQVEQSVARQYHFLGKFVHKKIPAEEAYLVVAQEFERMEKIGFDRFRDYHPDALLFRLGKFLWNLGDHEKAFEYFTLAERYAQPTEDRSYFFTQILNHLQSYFQEKKDYPRAIGYAQKLIDFHKNLHHNLPENQWVSTFWEGLASLDIASMLVEQGKLAESEAYAQHGYELAKTSGAKGSFQALHAEFDALQVVLSIKLKTGKLAEIQPLVSRSEHLKSKLEADPDRWYLRFKFTKYYRNLARWNELRGSFADAVRFGKLAQNLQDSLDQRNDARKFEQLRQRHEAEKYAAHIREIEQEKKQQWQLIFGMAVILLLLALAAWLNFKRLQAKRAEAAAATDALAALTRNFQEKSVIADALRSELENLATRSERNEQLETLAHSVLLREEDWLRFRSLFEKVHPGFIEEQKNAHPELSPAELRLLILKKLEMGDHEIANLLGVSLRSVYQTRWRLNKKMGEGDSTTT